MWLDLKSAPLQGGIKMHDYRNGVIHLKAELNMFALTKTKF